MMTVKMYDATNACVRIVTCERSRMKWVLLRNTGVVRMDVYDVEGFVYRINVMS